MRDKKKWDDKTRPEKMGRRDARQKTNREMKHKTKKNGKTRLGQKKEGQDTTKKNGETR